MTPNSLKIFLLYSITLLCRADATLTTFRYNLRGASSPIAEALVDPKGNVFSLENATALLENNEDDDAVGQNVTYRTTTVHPQSPTQTTLRQNICKSCCKNTEEELTKMKRKYTDLLQRYRDLQDRTNNQDLAEKWSIHGKAQIMTKSMDVPASHNDTLTLAERHLVDTDSYMNDVVFLERKFLSVRHKCRNQNEMCTAWASRGECLSNPDFMLTNCAPACRSCDKLIDPSQSSEIAEQYDLIEGEETDVVIPIAKKYSQPTSQPAVKSL